MLNLHLSRWTKQTLSRARLWSTRAYFQCGYFWCETYCKIRELTWTEWDIDSNHHNGNSQVLYRCQCWETGTCVVPHITMVTIMLMVTLQYLLGSDYRYGCCWWWCVIILFSIVLFVFTQIVIPVKFNLRVTGIIGIRTQWSVVQMWRKFLAILLYYPPHFPLIRLTSLNVKLNCKLFYLAVSEV